MSPPAFPNSPNGEMCRAISALNLDGSGATTVARPRIYYAPFDELEVPPPEELEGVSDEDMEEID